MDRSLRDVGEHDRDHSSTSTEVEKEIGDINNESKKSSEDRPPLEPLDGGAIEKQVTAKSANPSVNNVKAIPNGGLTAWLQVLGAFFLFFNSWVCAWRLVDLRCICDISAIYLHNPLFRN